LPVTYNVEVLRSYFTHVTTSVPESGGGGAVTLTVIESEPVRLSLSVTEAVMV
jgi:hypothetical protein